MDKLPFLHAGKYCSACMSVWMFSFLTSCSPTSIHYKRYSSLRHRFFALSPCSLRWPLSSTLVSSTHLRSIIFHLIFFIPFSPFEICSGASCFICSFCMSTIHTAEVHANVETSSMYSAAITEVSALGFLQPFGTRFCMTPNIFFLYSMVLINSWIWINGLVSYVFLTRRASESLTSKLAEQRQAKDAFCPCVHIFALLPRIDIAVCRTSKR